MSSGTERFDLHQLLTTVFQPDGGERVGIFIDLDDPSQVSGYKFLDDPSLQIQDIAYHKFFQELKTHPDKYGFGPVSFFAYKKTGGSNLDLPPTVFTPEGEELDLIEVLKQLDLVLYISTFSATAPITALAKEIGLRGATLHGVNEIILHSGLAKDYEEVSRQAELLRLAMTGSDSFDIEFDVDGRACQLTLELGRQEAQKSHGLCRVNGDIANLPAGEIYFIPEDAHGSFPMVYEDGTLALAIVEGNQIRRFELIKGEQSTLDRHQAKIDSDPATGELGELGLGTQELPWSGRDIQDEKVLGTVHVATGRSDHLGGSITPDRFEKAENASHDDILFAPQKTPMVNVVKVTMNRGGTSTPVIENYQPTSFVREILKG